MGNVLGCLANSKWSLSLRSGDGTIIDGYFYRFWTVVLYFKVGPPFACGVKFDGHNDYVNLGAWHPGYQASYEVWFRADIVQNWREVMHYILAVFTHLYMKCVASL